MCLSPTYPTQSPQQYLEKGVAQGIFWTTVKVREENRGPEREGKVKDRKRDRNGASKRATESPVDIRLRNQKKIEMEAGKSDKRV